MKLHVLESCWRDSNFAGNFDLTQPARCGAGAVGPGSKGRCRFSNIVKTRLLVVSVARGDGIGRAALNAGTTGPLGIPETPGVGVVTINSFLHRQIDT